MSYDSGNEQLALHKVFSLVKVPSKNLLALSITLEWLKNMPFTSLSSGLTDASLREVMCYDFVPLSVTE